MKKGLIIFGIILIIMFSNFIFALNYKECKQECLKNKTEGNLICSENLISCKEECNGLFEKRKCITNCFNEQTACMKKVNADSSDCEKYCYYKDKNITCENGKYKYGEIFEEGCKICKCEYNRRVSCKNTNFCNFKNVTIKKEICEKNGGFYNALCNGPYFDIVCSQQNFCICDGNSNYKCPSDYVCLHNFSLSLTRKGHTIPGWKTLLGFPLGNIGICAKKPNLLNCGDGICENKVLLNSDAETSLNCPEDCLKF